MIAWASEREAAQQRDRELQDELQAVRLRIVELEEVLKSAREALDAARDRRGELSAAQARVQSDVQHMAETCIQELSQQRDELMSDTSLPRVMGDELSNEDNTYREMRTRLDNMGPVNMMALEEYKETAERHQFLETQRQDLLQAIENTQNTIKEIDVISRQKFEEAFNIINENFGKTFSKLFGGGQGFMRLTDLENSMESGIDVVASPPGKKLQNVLLLSGGEKALTALALLVGIFQYQPSPFCILDEVDAPLDEANVGRFTELVRDMSVQTQFIIITHSKKTMNMAPVLYGVTMQEPGVSKLVSVRFGEEASAGKSEHVTAYEGGDMPDSIVPRFGCPNCNSADISENNVLPVSIRVSAWDDDGEPASYAYPWRERGGLTTDETRPRYHCHSCEQDFEEVVALDGTAVHPQV